MKLYYTKNSCSLVVRIIINEIGLNTEFESVDLRTKKTEHDSDFFNINPKGSVPVLQLDNGEILTENAIILQYLADTSKATTLLPPLGDFNRYRVLEWLNYTATEMHKGIGILFNPTITQDMKDNILIPLIKYKLKYVDQHLQNNRYLLGEQFTLPDAYLFVVLRWTAYFGLNLNEWSNIDRYMTELNHRKSIQQSLKQED